ncbi:hypothetical protein AB204_20510 [Xenorhabdus khoisanae]|uniref:Alpha-L-glutamate ligase-related protein ATP-grasp domain-containing protein n=1 Tax=Xenorhabdus khoisanae TaxID=880157 RepID=A0A0J5FMG8_9GAMM|nr:hypothetical protein AB204_20510 [Xenorhabdus khoisanae]
MIFNEYHESHRIQALSILSEIEKQKGKLNPSIKKKCDEYAVDALKWIGYAPWLYVYSAIANGFKEGWMPDNYYGGIVINEISGSYANISDLKSLSRVMLKTDNIPDLLYSTNGLLIEPVEKKVVNFEQAKENLFFSGEKIIFKPDESQQGSGIKFISKKEFNKELNFLNGVYQRIIVQHDFFNAICDKSVATLRLTTVINDGGICNVRAAYLRVGRNSDTHVKSSSHVRIPVDINSGELSCDGFLTNWNTINKHPDTLVKFGGILPSFKKCCDIAVQLHLRYPFVRCIGWDLIVDNNNDVQIMEWNAGHNDIKFSEATQGPCFKDLNWEKFAK